MNELEQVWRERIDWVQAVGRTIAVARIQSPLSDTCIRSQLQPASDFRGQRTPATKLTTRLPRHPFSVISGSDRVALQTEGLSWLTAHTCAATERTPESDYGDRFARTHEFRPAI